MIHTTVPPDRWIVRGIALRFGETDPADGYAEL